MKPEETEQFAVRFDGGPWSGTHTTRGPWPLPEVIVPSPEGKYVKRSESQLPPQSEGTHLMRGAEYEWVREIKEVSVDGGV